MLIQFLCNLGLLPLYLFKKEANQLPMLVLIQVNKDKLGTNFFTGDVLLFGTALTITG